MADRHSTTPRRVFAADPSPSRTYEAQIRIEGKSDYAYTWKQFTLPTGCDAFGEEICNTPDHALYYAVHELRFDGPNRCVESCYPVESKTAPEQPAYGVRDAVDDALSVARIVPMNRGLRVLLFPFGLLLAGAAWVVLFISAIVAVCISLLLPGRRTLAAHASGNR